MTVLSVGQISHTSVNPWTPGPSIAKGKAATAKPTGPSGTLQLRSQEIAASQMRTGSRSGRMVEFKQVNALVMDLHSTQRSALLSAW